MKRVRYWTSDKIRELRIKVMDATEKEETEYEVEYATLVALKAPFP